MKILDQLFDTLNEQRGHIFFIALALLRGIMKRNFAYELIRA